MKNKLCSVSYISNNTYHTCSTLEEIPRIHNCFFICHHFYSLYGSPKRIGTFCYILCNSFFSCDFLPLTYKGVAYRI